MQKDSERNMSIKKLWKWRHLRLQPPALQWRPWWMTWRLAVIVYVASFPSIQLF